MYLLYLYQFSHSYVMVSMIFSV